MRRVGVLVVVTGCLSTPGEAIMDFDAAVRDAAWVCADGDGDGWPAGEGGACEAEHVDCDDTDDAVHPGADETGSPTVDRDCDDLPWDGTGGLPPVVTGPVSNDLQVNVGPLVLRFDSDAGHAISDLRIGASGNLLFTGPMAERLVAVEAWDDFFSYEDAGLEDTLTAEADGPAVVRYRVDWQDGTDMSGTTTWTIHAGGRVYRREEIGLATQPSESNVTAYVALDDSALTHIDWASNGAAMPITFTPGDFNTWANLTPTEEWTCAYHDTALHEIGFLSHATTSAMTESVRITRSVGPSLDTAQLALQYDWNIGGPPPLTGAYTGSFQVVAGPSSGSPCAASAIADDAWRDPPGLTITGGAMAPAPGGEDDNRDGFAEGGGYWPIIVVSRPFEIELSVAGSVPPAITFRIEGLPPGDPVITVEHERTVTRFTHGRDYQLQQEAGFTWLVIRATPGNVIRIVAPPVPPF